MCLKAVIFYRPLRPFTYNLNLKPDTLLPDFSCSSVVWEHKFFGNFNSVANIILHQWIVKSIDH